MEVQHQEIQLQDKLLGIENYTLWSRSVRLALLGRNKIGLIDGTSRKEVYSDDLGGHWERVNAIVLSWLMNSVSKSLLSRIAFATTAFDVWNDLKERLSVRKEDPFEGGATWAYEVGSQSMVCPIIVEDLPPWAYEVGSRSMVCPIIVEDLNQPRQMLVEMLCEERGLFLEIADIIRGLGLTILMGVMETRNDKIWAQFVVEANRDVTRMEIFISLVRLLEQTAKGGTEPVNAADNNTTMVHSFHQAATLPATGRSCSLL
ncbi:hypothetical protein KY284_023269 [Solanum tuberosum]|nr:hypothetical protein KY284_023269 [Solanum tuberosum]